MTAVSSVRQLYLDGERHWPQFRLSFEAFESHCQRVFALEAPAGIAREAADLFLCCACAEGNAEALRRFEAEGLETARAAVTRIDRNWDFVQEVLQEVWDKLLLGPDAKIRQYSGRGPLNAWIRVAATRAALDRARSRGSRAKREVELSDELATHAPSPEAFLTQARFGSAFREAIGRAVAALSAQERNVLRMHVSGGCNIDEIGRVYQVHRATAARWLDRARARIYESVRSQLCVQHSQLTDSEFKSLAHLMNDQVDLCLSGSSHHADGPAVHG